MCWNCYGILPSHFDPPLLPDQFLTYGMNPQHWSVQQSHSVVQEYVTLICVILGQIVSGKLPSMPLLSLIVKISVSKVKKQLDKESYRQYIDTNESLKTYPISSDFQFQMEWYHSIQLE